MGLAGVFGDQNYVCKSCGHSMAEYAPHCPICLNKTLVRVESQRLRGPGKSANEQPARETQPPRNPVVAYGAGALLLALLIAAYNLFLAPKQDGSRLGQAPARSEVNDSARSLSQPVRHVKHVAPHPVAARVHTVPTARASAPPRTPMKLWQGTKEDEGGD